MAPVNKGELLFEAPTKSGMAVTFYKIVGGVHCGPQLRAPMVRLGLARGYALQGDAVRARAAYQDFL